MVMGRLIPDLIPDLIPQVGPERETLIPKSLVLISIQLPHLR